MRRRGLGVGAVHQKQQAEAKYKEKSAEMAKEQLNKLTDQMKVLQNNLQEFSVKHKKDIRKDHKFRRAFQSMCANVGVDPLSSSTNMWTKALGVGDIYYEIAIQVVEICMALNHRTGGVMDIHELFSRLIKSRKASQAKSDADISVDDIVRAVDKIAILGSGIQLIKCHNTYLVHSLSSEVNLDQNEVIKLAQQSNGHVTAQSVIHKLNWSPTKCEKALNNLVMEGIVWVDRAGPNQEVLYWVPGLFHFAT